MKWDFSAPEGSHCHLNHWLSKRGGVLCAVWTMSCRHVSILWSRWASLQSPDLHMLLELPPEFRWNPGNNLLGWNLKTKQNYQKQHMFHSQKIYSSLQMICLAVVWSIAYHSLNSFSLQRNKHKAQDVYDNVLFFYPLIKYLYFLHFINFIGEFFCFNAATTLLSTSHSN